MSLIGWTRAKDMTHQQVIVSISREFSHIESISKLSMTSFGHKTFIISRTARSIHLQSAFDLNANGYVLYCTVLRD